MGSSLASRGRAATSHDSGGRCFALRTGGGTYSRGHPRTPPRGGRAQLPPRLHLWSRRRVACADCHMPYKRDGAIKISDHHVRSPLLNISRACQICHRYPETEILARAEAIQDRTEAPHSKDYLPGSTHPPSADWLLPTFPDADWTLLQKPRAARLVDKPGERRKRCTQVDVAASGLIRPGLPNCRITGAT